MTSHDRFKQLQDDMDGRVISPGDDGYDAARTLFYGGFERHPAAIAKVAGDDDVAKVIALATDEGLDLSVRSGGHGILGHAVVDDGIVVDLAEMKGLRIDPDGRTAWAETGLTAGEYTTATARHGLATGFGDTGSVGIGGITLAGGIGFLVRKHGLTIDSVLAADIVTADGRRLRVDEDNHPDLFWAIRGGGGNFGVVTRFQFRLHPVDQVAGGFLILPARPDVVAGFLEAAEKAPEELSTIANVMPAPPMPMIPEERHGELVVFGMLTFAGDPDQGHAAIAPFRELAEPVADLVRTMPYPEMYLPDEEEEFHPIGSAKTRFVDAITESQIESVLHRLEESPAMMAVTQLRVLGGAMARVSPDATAFAHRERKLMATVAGLFGTAEDAAAHSGWVEETAGAYRTEGAGAYVGFLGDEGEEGFAAAYPRETRQRLAAIKAEYDPENLFRSNHNIVPRRDTAAA